MVVSGAFTLPRHRLVDAHRDAERRFGEPLAVITAPQGLPARIARHDEESPRLEIDRRGRQPRTLQQILHLLPFDGLRPVTPHRITRLDQIQKIHTVHFYRLLHFSFHDRQRTPAGNRSNEDTNKRGQCQILFEHCRDGVSSAKPKIRNISRNYPECTIFHKLKIESDTLLPAARRGRGNWHNRK